MELYLAALFENCKTPLLNQVNLNLTIFFRILAEKSGTIALHMQEYFKNGGDVDFFITEEKFSHATGYDLYYLNVDNFNFDIERVISSYEVSCRNRQLMQNYKQDVEEFGGDAVGKFKLPKFCPQYRLTIPVFIIENITVSMDMITDEEYKHLCDFTCNLGVIRKDFEIDLKFRTKNCDSLDIFVALIKKRTLRVLPYNQNNRACKLIFRLARRLEKGWKIDTTDPIGIEALAEYLVRAIRSDDDDIYNIELTETENKENNKYGDYIESKCRDIFNIFLCCKNSIGMFLQSDYETSVVLR